MAKYLVLNLEEAARAGLITCTCGHPENNHFSWDDRAKSCAHCKCPNYRLKAKNGYGRLIDVPAITTDDLVDAIKEATHG